MLLFLDESYERTDDGYRCVLGGFAVSEEGHRALVAAVARIKAARFLQDRDLSADAREAIWSDRFIVGADPREVELKASLLLSSSILRRRSSIALRIAAEVLEALRDSGATVHGVLAHPPTVRSGLTASHFAVLDAAQAAHPLPLQAVLDGTNPNADRALARRFSEAVLSDPLRFLTLGPTPFILDTHTSPGLQVADLVAHVLLQRARPSELRKPLETLDALVASMERSGPPALPEDGRSSFPPNARFEP